MYFLIWIALILAAKTQFVSHPPPPWGKYRYLAFKTYFAVHANVGRVDDFFFFYLKAKPSCWLSRPWLDDSACPPACSCLWLCPGVLRGSRGSGGAVRTGPCCRRVSGAAVAGWLQGWELSEAAVTPAASLQDLIDSIWPTAWAWCEERSNVSISCNYLLCYVITCNCLLFIKSYMHVVLLNFSMVV